MTYTIYFLIGLVVNMVVVMSPAFKRLVVKQISRLREEPGYIGKEKTYIRLGYVVGTLGAIVGAATVSLPSIIVRYIMACYKEPKDNEPNGTAPAKV